ncbi:MAG TPA: FecR domain-containing protein [Turneriella sp.]|nr:FecR domain-containing protein [Turneriella sp.]
MKFSKADAAFTAAMAAGIALLSGALYLHSRTRGAGSGDVIGKVYYKREVAMRKFSDRMVWEDVDNGSPLYSHDAVMTGNYSDAELVLNSGLKLRLEANTLIELDLEGEGLKLKLAGGGIKATGAEGSRTTVTTTDGQAISMNEASASIRTSGEQTAVEVSSGQVAVVNKEGSAQTVAKDEVLAAGQKSRVTLKLTGLVEDAIILAAGSNGRVSVSCSGDAESAEFSKRSDMQSARTVKLAAGKATTQLPAGDWYTRCRGAGNAISAVRHFRILNAGSYQVYRPDGDVKYSDKPELRFEFKAPRGVTKTRLEIAANARLENAVFDQVVSQSIAAVVLPGPGRWYYRLTAAEDAGRIESQLPGSSGSFVMSKSPQAQTLSLISVAEPVFPVAQLEAGKAFINYDGSGSYQYEIVPRTGGAPVASGNTAGGSIKLPPDLKGGNYALRIARESEKVSQPFTVRERMTVQLQSPGDGSVIWIPAGSEGASVAVSWKASDEVNLYQLILAEDSDLKRVLRKLNVHQDNFRFTGLKRGSYYLKVLALENGIPRAETKTVRLHVEDRLPPVAEVFPKDDSRVDVTRTAGLQLRWQAVVGANSYEVRLLQKRRGELVPVQTLVTNKPTVVVSDIRKFKEGEVVWEIRAQQADKSGKVLQKSEPVRNSLNVSFGATPPAPEIVPIIEE